MGNSVKKITLLLVITFTFLFSTTSWGDWSYVSKNTIGSKYYYDKDRVRKSGKFLYVWLLMDYLKPVNGGLSNIVYSELDCSILRFKYLKLQIYNNSMGEGGKIGNLTPPDEWFYPEPDTVFEYVYNKICEEHQ